MPPCNWPFCLVAAVLADRRRFVLLTVGLLLMRAGRMTTVSIALLAVNFSFLGLLGGLVFGLVCF